MTNTELRKEAEKYIEENNIVSNTYEIEKAFIDGAKFLRDKAEVNNSDLDDVINTLDKMVSMLENTKPKSWRDKINAIGYIKHILSDYL